MFVLVHVEAGQPQDGGDRVEGPNSPEQPPLEELVVREHDEDRRHAKRDDVAQTVQFLAELARLLGHPSDVPIEHVKNHAQEDQQGRVERQIGLQDAGA